MSLYIKEHLLQYRREYYKNNREKQIENVKNYILENKGKIEALHKKRYICPCCNRDVKYYGRIEHYTSKYHRNKVKLKIYFKKWLTSYL